MRSCASRGAMVAWACMEQIELLAADFGVMG